MVFQQLGIIGKDVAGLGIFDVRFHRHGAVGAQHLHQLGGEEDGVEIILLEIGRPLEDLADDAAYLLEQAHGVAQDRKSVVPGKRVSVRVDSGGRRSINTTNSQLVSKNNYYLRYN